MESPLIVFLPEVSIKFITCFHPISFLKTTYARFHTHSSSFMIHDYMATLTSPHAGSLMVWFDGDTDWMLAFRVSSVG